jgi:plasmid stabilization system protein ParE
MAQKIIWSINAFKDLQNLVDYISEDSVVYAMSVYEDVMDKAQTLLSSRIEGGLFRNSATLICGNFLYIGIG